MANENDSILSMDIRARMTEDGHVQSEGHTRADGYPYVLLSALCSGVHKLLLDMDISDVEFMERYMEEDWDSHTSVRMDVGTIERAMNSLKEGEDNA